MNNVTVKVKDNTYVINQFHAIKGWDILKKLSCVMTAGSANDIALKIIEQDEDNKLLFLLLSEVLYNNAPICTTEMFNKLFAGKLTDILMLIIEVLKLNFSDFLATGGIGEVVENIKQVLQPQQTDLQKSEV